MTELTSKEIDLVKLLARDDMIEVTEQTRTNIESQIGPILRQYYKENTQGLAPCITEKFKKAGITEDDGKSAISRARRLGVMIY